MSYRYHLTYEIRPHPAGVDRGDIPEHCGASDALFVASILYPPDGSLSVMTSGLDGRTGEDLADLEVFKVFTLLAKRLAESETLTDEKREFAETIWRAVSAAIRGDRVKT